MAQRRPGRGRKIAGILAQLGPLGGAGTPPVILGTGLNVTLTEPELPVPTATSVLLENPDTVDRTELLQSYLSRFATLYRSFCNADGDPAAGMAGGPSLHKRVEHLLSTLGKQVRAQLPGDHEIIGHATRLDEYGSLLVVDAAGHEHVVTAGDVVHLRPWNPAGTGGQGDSGGQKAVMRRVLLPGEQVIVVTRPQPRMLIVPALMFVVVPALAASPAPGLSRAARRGSYPSSRKNGRRGWSPCAWRWRRGCCWPIASRGSLRGTPPATS